MSRFGATDLQDCVRAKKVLRKMNFDALDLAETDRIQLVEGYHRQAKIKVPGMTAHCAIHAIVENQLAMKLDFVAAALDRLTKQGLGMTPFMPSIHRQSDRRDVRRRVARPP